MRKEKQKQVKKNDDTHNSSFGDAVRSRGLRLTKTRMYIATVLEKKAVTLKELLKECTTMEESTVYRTLEEFTEIGLIRSVSVSNGVVRYELADDHHHDHIECVVCARVEHIPCVFGASIRAPQIQSWQIVDHEILWKGTCSLCS